MPSTASFEYEKVDERFSGGAIGQPSTVTHTYIVWRKVGTIDIGKDASLMMTENLLPEMNEYFNLPSAGVRDWAQYARFKGYDAEYIGNGKARFVYRYSTLYVPDPVIVAGQELALPASTDYQSLVRTIKVYRYGYVTDPPSTVADSTMADIGGISVQGTRGALDIQVPQMRVRLRLVVNADVQAISAAAGVVIQYVNKQNNAAFLGFPAYSVICEGASLSTIDNDFYEVVFDFLYDRFYHHEQVVTMDADGRPTMTSGGNYLRVDWKRLPRTKIDFNDIFSTATRQKARAEKGFF